MANTQYDVFLSYSSKDRPWVAEFTAALREAGAQAWSVDEIMLGETWQEKVEEALRQSHVFVVLISSNNLASPWMFFELGAAIADNKKIIPVLIEDVEMSQVPSALKRLQILRASSPTAAGKQVAEVIEKISAKDISA